MTKEYLKMADAFPVLISNDELSATFVYPKAKYAANAINTHDELVAEVERLRGVVDELERENENISAILLERTSALGPYI